MAKEKIYRVLASRVQAQKNCLESNNTEWYERHGDAIRKLMKEHAPDGAGFDNGTKLDFDESTGECLTLTTSFHHTDEAGGYDGWTEHIIHVSASLLFGFTLTISGPNRNEIKEYIHETFALFLSTEIEQYEL